MRVAAPPGRRGLSRSLSASSRALVSSAKRLASKVKFTHMPGAAQQAGRHPGAPDMSPEGIDRLVIMPDNRIKGAFDGLIACCVMFTSVVIGRANLKRQIFSPPCGLKRLFLLSISPPPNAVGRDASSPFAPSLSPE